jgi:excisionase family DNA binding protein
MLHAVAHAAYIREKARSMRIERRLTIDELAERLALPRSTIYYWVRDLPIPGSGPGGEFSASARRTGRMWRSHHGVISARLHDTMLRARLEAWMFRIRGSWL